jgi:hypothetical protein
MKNPTYLQKQNPQKYNHALNAAAPDLCAITNALK